jgi:hypothetical protein
MVHRTDFAGSVGCSTGQPISGDDGRRRHEPSGALPGLFPKTSSYFYPGGKKCSRLFMTAVPSVPAIYVETLGPMKR